MICVFVWKLIQFLSQARNLASWCSENLKWGVVMGLVIVLGVSACSTATPTTPPLSTGAVPLTPYWTATPSLTLSPTGTPLGKASTATLPPAPSATPFTYEVKKGDTMLAIAFRYGITLDELQAANPDIDPQVLSVGTKLVIPIKDKGSPTAVPTPTPAPVTIDTPRCYASADGGAWCLAEAHNDQALALENLSAQISLVAPGGKVITSTVAIPPLNILPPDSTLPLMVFFPPDVFGKVSPEQASVQAGLLSAFTVADNSGRYLPVRVQVTDERVNATGLQATVRGRVEYPLDLTPTGTPAKTTATPAKPASNPPIAKQVWLAVVAFGEDGHVVGVRKWEADRDLKPGKKLEFDITVFSFGPPIQSVAVVAEARP